MSAPLQPGPAGLSSSSATLWSQPAERRSLYDISPVSPREARGATEMEGGGVGKPSVSLGPSTYSMLLDIFT